MRPVRCPPVRPEGGDDPTVEGRDPLHCWCDPPGRGVSPAKCPLAWRGSPVGPSSNHVSHGVPVASPDPSNTRIHNGSLFLQAPEGNEASPRWEGW